ncbi:MAG: hypothetical protein LBB64_00025 [Dysgonamonadaceae bacterium]|nr:hypothetical protein [Dysgonamonadaceae bacterium]
MVADTTISTERIPYVDYDEQGNPIWFTVEDWFDELDQKLIAHFGEEYRILANERRARWNKQSDWNFRPL